MSHDRSSSSLDATNLALNRAETVNRRETLSGVVSLIFRSFFESRRFCWNPESGLVPWGRGGVTKGSRGDPLCFISRTLSFIFFLSSRGPPYGHDFSRNASRSIKVVFVEGHRVPVNSQWGPLKDPTRHARVSRKW